MRIHPALLLSAAVALLTATLSVAQTAPRPAAPTGPVEGIPRVKLWEKTPLVVEGNETNANPTEPTMDLYLPPADKANGTAVMVLPGGGYSNLAMGHEGNDVGNFFLKNNVAAFVVRYRHGPRYHQPIPLLDAQRALRTVRAKAQEFHVDPTRIGVLGFSAGGHLAASVATLFNAGPKPEAGAADAIDQQSARPDFAILMYPVINLSDDAVTHKGSRTQFTQDNKDLFVQYSLETRVTKETPPVFLVHGTNDRVVPVQNSLLFYSACLKNGVPAELHIFENGPHGFGLGPNDAALKQWPDLALTWMSRHKWLTPAGTK
jgi:acetyl esterase/lipase